MSFSDCTAIEARTVNLMAGVKSDWGGAPSVVSREPTCHQYVPAGSALVGDQRVASCSRSATSTRSAVTNSPVAANRGECAIEIESATSGALTVHLKVGWVEVVELPGAGDSGVGAAMTPAAQTAALTAAVAAANSFSLIPSGSADVRLRPSTRRRELRTSPGPG